MNAQMVENALKSFLLKVDEVANIAVTGIRGMED
jgi:hypothetical protein